MGPLAAPIAIGAGMSTLKGFASGEGSLMDPISGGISGGTAGGGNPMGVLGASPNLNVMDLFKKNQAIPGFTGTQPNGLPMLGNYNRR